jgi:tetratricopeptide (TPR) repeat protein
MNKRAFWLSIIGIIISFAGGFLLANALNRREIDELKARIGTSVTTPDQAAEENDSEQALSDEEISQKIEEADKNPGNADFQKSLAMALYRYSSMKQESKWLPEVAKLLNRVHEKNPNDYNTIVSLGNLYFDIAQNGGESEKTKNLEKAREFYQKALIINPKDTEIRNDLGFTYLLSDQPDNSRAIAEFQKSLQANPMDERALEGSVRAGINTGNIKDAETNLEKLRQTNSDNESITELETQLTQKKNNK